MVDSRAGFLCGFSGMGLASSVLRVRAMKTIKTATKKLQLGRETLRLLDRGNLDQVGGARVCTALASTCDPNTQVSCHATICNCGISANC